MLLWKAVEVHRRGFRQSESCRGAAVGGGIDSQSGPSVRKRRGWVFKRRSKKKISRTKGGYLLFIVEKYDFPILTLKCERQLRIYPTQLLSFPPSDQYQLMEWTVSLLLSHSLFLRVLVKKTKKQNQQKKPHKTQKPHPFSCIKLQSWGNSHSHSYSYLHFFTLLYLKCWMPFLFLYFILFFLKEVFLVRGFFLFQLLCYGLFMVQWLRFVFFFFCLEFYSHV